jgi:hypothetical protein
VARFLVENNQAEEQAAAEAAVVARRLSQDAGESLHVTCSLPGYRSEDTALYLRRTEPAKPTQPGQVLVDTAQVTFIGRSGLPNPFTWRLALCIALFVFPFIYAATAHMAILPLVEEDIQQKLRIVATLLPALLLVYLPASALLAPVLSGRVTVSRRYLVSVTRLGDLLSVVIHTRGVINRLTLTADDPADLDALTVALTPNKISPVIGSVGV